MNWIDFLFFLIIVAGLVRGFIKGMIFEITGFVGLIIAIYVSRYHSTPFAEFIHDFFNVSTDYTPALGMIAAFVVSMLVVKVIAMFTVKLIKAVSLNWLNKLLGAFFSALKYTLALSIMTNLLGAINQKITIVDSRHSEESVLYAPINAFAPTVLPLLDIHELFALPKNIEDSI